SQAAKSRTKVLTNRLSKLSVSAIGVPTRARSHCIGGREATASVSYAQRTGRVKNESRTSAVPSGGGRDIGCTIRARRWRRSWHVALSLWRPLHDEIHAFVRNRDKAQPFVESHGRVALLHMDAHGLVGGGGFGQEVTQDGAADAGVAGGWQQGDI